MMAEDLYDGGFWLPPKFLSEDKLHMEFSKIIEKSNNGKLFGENNGGYDFPSGFVLDGPNLDMISPVESVVGSTETESDEEEYLSGLSRKLAQSALYDDLWKADRGLGYEMTKSWSVATSPQSTLSNVMGNGCGCKQGSSRGSPNCPSPPPSATVIGKNETAWELLYAAAGEVAKMRMVEEGAAANAYNRSRAHLSTPRKPGSITVPLKTPNLGFHSNQSLSFQQQLQVNQFQQLKRQQMMKQRQLMMKQQQQGRLGWGQQQMVHESRARYGSNDSPLGLSPSAWPTLQQSQQQQPTLQQPGSGMRAVFLGNPGAKRECSGTGVFLPRRVGTPTETLKKPGCSTVLLPDRVVQALNLNLEAMDTAPRLQIRSISNNTGFSPDYDAAVKYRNNVLTAQAHQRPNVARPQPVHMNNEVRLPQEWTY